MENYLFYALLSSFLFIFIYFHIHPLSDKQVNRLAHKRRRKKIRSYFSFGEHLFTVSTAYKKMMKANGAYVFVDEPLKDFPSIAAALLKFRKHEWIIIAFETNQKVKYFWANKGEDRTSVSIFLKPEVILDVATRNNYTSVLIFHNHPNSNPRYYDCSKPSKEDIVSADNLAKIIVKKGYNLFEFVCERGKPYKYFQAISDNFMPIGIFVEHISKVNGKGKVNNLLLHLERIF